jgi:hypothetical protein
VPYEEGALREGGEEMQRVRPAIRAEVRVAGPLEKFAANDPGDDLDIAQLRSAAALPSRTDRREVLIMFFYHTVPRNDKRIAVQWMSPRIVAVARQLFYGEVSKGPPQELHIRYTMCITCTRRDTDGCENCALRRGG